MACGEIQVFRLLPKTWHAETPTHRAQVQGWCWHLQAGAGRRPHQALCDSGCFCSALAQLKSIDEGEDVLQGRCVRPVGDVEAKGTRVP